MQTPREPSPSRNPWLAALYWLLTGAIIGVGVIAILSIGILLLLLGFGLVVFGAWKIGARGLWAAVVGFGAVPALILQYDVVTAPPLCSGVNHVGTVCGGPTDAYQMLALIFAAIAVVGILIGLGLALIHLWPAAPASDSRLLSGYPQRLSALTLTARPRPAHTSRSCRRSCARGQSRRAS